MLHCLQSGFIYVYQHKLDIWLPQYGKWLRRKSWCCYLWVSDGFLIWVWGPSGALTWTWIDANFWAWLKTTNQAYILHHSTGSPTLNWDELNVRLQEWASLPWQERAFTLHYHIIYMLNLATQQNLVVLLLLGGDGVFCFLFTAFVPFWHLFWSPLTWNKNLESGGRSGSYQVSRVRVAHIVAELW